MFISRFVRTTVATLMLLSPLAVTEIAIAQQCDPGGGMGGTGPDVMVGELTGTQSYGLAAGHYAYSVGTTSCNISSERDEPAQRWRSDPSQRQIRQLDLSAISPWLPQ